MVCTVCNRMEIRTVTTQGIHRHNISQRHRRNLGQEQRENAPPNGWEYIQNELHLSPDLFTNTDNVVTCHCCHCRLQSITVAHIRQHINTRKHREAEELWRTVPQPCANVVARCTPRQNAYYMELTGAMMASDNPLNKLRDERWKNHQEKWTRQKQPDPSTLRKSYVPQTYQAVLQQIRDEVGDHAIHLSVDETTDSASRIIANAIVTPLLPDGYGIPRLQNIEQLIEANAETICDFINASLNLLWLNGIQHDKVLLYATDAALYMVLSGTQLRDQHNYMKLAQVTCLCHALHRTAEAVRREYKMADKIIGTTKKVFKKSPVRTQMFRDIAGTNVPFPPEPILTRWGTWITASTYYAEHIAIVSDVIEQLEDNAVCVKKAKEYFSVANIAEDFQCISEKFQCIPATITRLEARELTLNDTLEILREIYDQLVTDDDIPDIIRIKMARIFERNRGFHQMIDVADCLQRDIFDRLPAGWTIEDARVCSFAALTSVEVERSFSRYKSIFRSNRQSFLFKNLRSHVIVSCFL